MSAAAAFPCACERHHLEMAHWRDLDFALLDTWGEHRPLPIGGCTEYARLAAPVRELVRGVLGEDVMGVP